MHARNPRLVYGRMTGWGQDGPARRARRPRHQLHRPRRRAATRSAAPARRRCRRSTSSATSAAAACCSPSAIACGAASRRERAGRGQVVDAAMVDGASLLATMFSGFLASGMWQDGERGANVLDSGAPWYDTYATRDGKHVAIGAIEAKFYAELLDRLGLDAVARRDPARPVDVARAARSLRGDVLAADARRVGSDLRRLGRVLRAGALVRRIAPAPARGSARRHRSRSAASPSPRRRRASIGRRARRALAAARARQRRRRGACGAGASTLRRSMRLRELGVGCT